MHFNSSSKWTLLMSLAILVLASSFLRTRVKAQENEPQTVILKGRVIDLTCAVKGKVAMGAWNNIAQDHMMEDGNLQKGCATLCLLGVNRQPSFPTTRSRPFLLAILRVRGRLHTKDIRWPGM